MCLFTEANKHHDALSLRESVTRLKERNLEPDETIVVDGGAIGAKQQLLRGRYNDADNRVSLDLIDLRG